MFKEELIGLVYEGTVEDDPWSSFLHALRQQFRANSTMLMFGLPDADARSRDIDDSDWQVTTIRNLYYSRYVTENPIRYEDMAAGRVYSMFDFIPREQFVQSPYYLDFCQHLGIDVALIACLGEVGGVPSWLNIARSDDHGDFSPADVAQFAALIPHLRRALRIRAEIDAARQQTRAYSGALDSARLCTVLLDAQRRVIGMNAEAEHLFAGSAAVSANGTGLAFAARADQSRFHALFDSVVGNGVDGGYGVMISGSGCDAPASIMLRRSRQGPQQGGRGTIAAIAYLKNPAAPVQAHAQAIAALFGLKPTEARLAATLAQGADIREAALHLGMTEQTVRTYVKRILQKTGTRRQSELVQMISTSLAVLT